ncbi:hypothetical protein EV196_1135 [Mariniflexile fucanivorans]|uniref:Uncharacterized protein n=1 Tax=Mariniflexile fucanivorans TaxID=264023 RepID=A0A4R1R9Q8_9FLAO|nr:hypothetical protein [Mariniflexile fucanivorans]TCL62464.1 hypothetical protein EV196_1135 [Mariniflexile fucanivorans]
MNKKDKLLTLIPALWTSLFDSIITIVNQPKEYWDGDLDVANEANSIGYFIMKQHVSGIFILCGIWLILIGIIGYYLPKKYSRVFLLFVLMAHTFGAGNWLIMNYGFWTAIIFVLFNTILFYKIQDLINRKSVKIGI